MTMPDASQIGPADILKRVEEIQTAAQNRGDVEMLWLCHKLRTALADTRRVDYISQDDVFVETEYVVNFGTRWVVDLHFDDKPPIRGEGLTLRAAADAAMAATPRER